MDVPTRWNSTFLMLDSALPLKEAFGRLEQIDRNYKLNPSEDEWKVAYIVHDCLKKFYDATNHFSGNSFPTSNVFFPDICKLQLKLKEWENSDHDFIRNMAAPMKEKFEKYWDECCLVLAIAVVFDPRFKLALVEYNYNAIYGENAKKYVDRVRSAIVDLFVEYGGELNPSFGYACGSDVEERNRKVFCNALVDAKVLVQRAWEEWWEFEQLNRNDSRRSTRKIGTHPGYRECHPPQFGTVKNNTDAALKVQLGRAGWGAVARGSDGKLLKELQYAGNQLVTVGANVKQFCSELMEEMLPASIMNSLQEETYQSESNGSVDHACGVLDREDDASHINEPSDSDSSTYPISMETVEAAHSTAFTLKAYDGNEMSFEEVRVKETKYLSDILNFEGHSDGEFHGLDNLSDTLQVDQSSYSTEAGETSDRDPRYGESNLSTTQDLAASVVSAGSHDSQLLENEMSSSGHTLLEELIDDELDGHKAVEMKDKYITIADIMQLPNKVKIENSCIILDCNECSLTSDYQDHQHPIYQRTACKSCLMSENAAGSKDCNAECDQPEGELISQPLLTGELESVDEEFCELDWVLV
ncbi:hypothetical protein ACH5RR_018100 [Cinchona calisaya]|uniref:hAT-like transposase RNase-H fold domain-containing protein n=1 Tax=Cinchona calisaya TaxID=153742 RepID=A0ABD2ZKH3_9GENT